MVKQEDSQELKSIAKTLYQLNGTLMRGGEAGQAFERASKALETIASLLGQQNAILEALAKTQSFQNSNLGVIRQSLETIARKG